MAKSVVQVWMGRVAHSFNWNNDLPIVRHGDAGARCQGWLMLRIHEEHTQITCNECHTIIRAVPAEQVDAVRSALRWCRV
jgi:hypothetical protein